MNESLSVLTEKLESLERNCCDDSTGCPTPADSCTHITQDNPGAVSGLHVEVS